MFQILDVIAKACNYKVTIFHSGACEFLRCLADRTFNTTADETQFCTRVPALFSVLMLDTNPVTKQVALDTFSYFAHVTKYPKVIANTVSNNLRLQSEVINFIEGKPAGSSQKSLNEHLKYFEQCFKHRCKPNADYRKLEVDDTEPNPCKKAKTCISEEMISAAIERIEQDLHSIEEYCCISVLSKSNNTSLTNIHNRIDKIVNISKLDNLEI